MNGTLVIASRELRERSRVFLMAAAIAVLPFLTAFVPAARNDRALAIAGVAGFLAVALAAGLAVAQGTSTIAGELAAKRMSFYFSKPVSPAAIWFGKLIAALLTSFAAFAIVMGPALLVTGRQWRVTFGGPRLFAAFAALILVLFLASHVLSSIIRSRSALIGLDFLFAALAGGAVFYIIRPLFTGGSMLAPQLLSIIGIAMLLIAMVAPVWQLAKGRTDIRRSHAALSRVLWISLAVVLAIAGAYVAWLVNVDPSDLTGITNISQAPGGKTLFLSGIGRGRGDYHSSFLVDVNGGSYTRIAAPPFWGVDYSQDGNVVAWAQPLWRVAGLMELELYTKRLDQPGSKPEATGIRRSGGAFALSPDGSRLATVSEATISVHDLNSNRILASARRNPLHTVALYFVSPDVVRFYQSARGSERIDLYELDVRTKSLVKTGELHGDAGYNGVRSSWDGSRVLLPRNGIVADGRTGATLATLPASTPNIFGSAMLGNGMIAIVKRDTPRVSKLTFFNPDGTPARAMSLPVHMLMISGETTDGKVIAVGYDKGDNDAAAGKGRKMLVIDPAAGTIVRTLNDIKGPMPNWAETRLPRFAPNEKLVAVNAEGKLVTWIPSTGEVQALR